MFDADDEHNKIIRPVGGFCELHKGYSARKNDAGIAPRRVQHSATACLLITHSRYRTSHASVCLLYTGSRLAWT